MSESKTPVYCRVGTEDRQVLIMFTKDPEGSKPANISHWRIDPKECLEIAEAMAGAAFESRDDMKPAGPALKAELVERHRMTLTHRVALMLKTNRWDQNMTDGKIAQQVVDACLKEIF